MHRTHRWLILGLCFCAACAGAQSTQSPPSRSRRDAGPPLGTPSALSNYDGRDASALTPDAATGDAR